MAQRKSKRPLSSLLTDEMRMQHKERLVVNRRIEELKVRLLRLTDQQMEQVVRLIRRLLHGKK